jgi:hypothetical protein
MLFLVFKEKKKKVGKTQKKIIKTVNNTIVSAHAKVKNMPLTMFFFKYPKLDVLQWHIKTHTKTKEKQG